MTHNFAPIGKRAKRSTCSIPWLCCRRCGLILLKNRATDAASRKACPGLEDPAGFEGW